MSHPVPGAPRRRPLPPPPPLRGQRAWKWTPPGMPSAVSAAQLRGDTAVAALLARTEGLDVPRTLQWTGGDCDALVAWLRDEGVATLCDLHGLSDDVFARLTATATQSLAVPPAVWAALDDARRLSHDLPLVDALAQFGDTLAPQHLMKLNDLPDVGSLQQLDHAAFMALDVPAVLQTTLQRIRDRNRLASRHLPMIIRLPCPKLRQLSRIVRGLTRYKLPHASWRKSETSQTVVSAITYAPHCKCSNATTHAGSSRKQREALYPGAWCTCDREVVYAVNYELSTPSGSRCAEQNALGQIAAIQPPVPTSCIREVFVRGVAAPGLKDPNPLSPCGTCENMIGKLSAHVRTAHGGGEVMLFMLDAQTPSPTKLVALPFSEISVRASPRFLTFVNKLRG